MARTAGTHRARACLALFVVAPLLAQERTAYLVPTGTAVAWRDALVLPAVAAAAATGNGKPIVLAVDAAAPWRPELLDFLRRYAPQRLVWVGDAPPEGAPAGAQLTTLGGDSLAAVAAEIADHAWPQAKTAVLCTFNDRAAALGAAVLAARTRVPLLPCGKEGLDPAVRAQLAAFGIERVTTVGADVPGVFEGLRVERLLSAIEVGKALRRRGHAIEYIATTSADDAHDAHAPNLSLAAALLAVGRNGAVLPIARDVVWKRRLPTTAELPKAPPGAGASNAGWWTGRLDAAAGGHSFVTGQDPEDGRFFVRIDRNGDGDFVDADEGPWRTGEDAALGTRRWTVDLDADEKARGRSLWLSSPTVAELNAELRGFVRAVAITPDSLCLVGWPEQVPLAILGDGLGIDADLVSDLPHGQLDDDPFVELATARFVAEDLASATLLACRSLAYHDFAERAWAGRFATAEWETIGKATMEAAGLLFAGHHDGVACIEQSSPLADVGFLLHGSHAMWTELGKTSHWDTRVLLAPCIVESSGCSTAALDMDAQHRSVPARLLRNGAVAFVGNNRRGTAQQELFRSEFWNGLLSGLTVGQANRAALNRMLVAGLDRGQTTQGIYRYQLACATVFGDPALDVGRTFAKSADTARVEVRGQRATVYAPREYWRTQYAPLAEWGCAVSTLTTWRGPGIGAESTWYGPEKRDQHELWFTAEVRTKLRVVGLEAVDKPEAPLGWAGNFFVDEHSDGSRSVFWRVRLVDFDMTKGQITQQADKLSYRLRTR